MKAGTYVSGKCPLAVPDQPRSWLLVGAVFGKFQQKCLGVSTWNHLESLSAKIQLSLGPGTQWGLP